MRAEGRSKILCGRYNDLSAVRRLHSTQARRGEERAVFVLELSAVCAAA